MPFVPAVYWGSDAKLLAGGKLVFYARGTTTPQTVYADLDNAVPLNGPDGSVTLDGAGHKTIYLGPRAYTVWSYSAAGVQQFEPIDVQGGGTGAGSFGTGTVTEVVNLGNGLIVKTYVDVGALNGTYNVLWVSGRVTEGDGGQGWFARIPGSTATPDGGIILASGSNIYARVFDGWIDPRWYGVQYGASSAQETPFLSACAASALYGCPVLVTGMVYLSANLTLPVGCSLRMGPGGNFQAPSAVSLTLPAGMHFESEGVAFGVNVQPKFGAGVASEIRLSWMGEGTGDARLLKLAAAIDSSVTGPERLVVDVPVSTASATTFPASSVLDFVGGGKITISSPANFSAPAVAYQGDAAVLIYSVAANLLTLTFGSGPVRPEWFGAVGDGAADDSLPLLVAATCGKVFVRRKYLSGTTWAVTNDVTISGDLPDVQTNVPDGSRCVLTLAAGVTVSTGRLTLASAQVTGLGLLCKVTSLSLTTRNAAVGFAFTNVVAGFISTGVVDLQDSRFALQDLILSSGGKVVDSTFIGSGSFPVSVLDTIEGSTAQGYGGHASTSHLIRSLVDRCAIQGSGTINLGSALVRDTASLSSSAAFWHFAAVNASSRLEFERVTVTHSLIKLNATSTATVDAFAGDVVNSIPASPADSEAVLLANGLGTLNVRQRPVKSGQLWPSIAGVPTDTLRYLPGNVQINAAPIGTDTENLCLFPQDWKALSGTAPTGDGALIPGTTPVITYGTYISPANDSAFSWKKGQFAVVGPSAGTWFELPGEAGGWANLLGVVVVTLVSPSGAKSGGEFTLTIDSSSLGGTGWTVNKRVKVPASIASETIQIALPVLGGYWKPQDTRDAPAQWGGIQAKLSGSGLSGYRFSIFLRHLAPVSEDSLQFWSDTVADGTGIRSNLRNVRFIRSENSKLFLEGFFAPGDLPAAGGHLGIPYGTNWYTAGGTMDIALLNRMMKHTGNAFSHARSDSGFGGLFGVEAVLVTETTIL